MRGAIFGLILAAVLVTPVAGFGDRGHKLVGAIADRRLANHNPMVRDKVKALLHGLTLETVAVYADTIIKTLDTKTPQEVFSDHPELNQLADLREQLRAFHSANATKPFPAAHEVRHRLAHYTDIPVIGATKYTLNGPGQNVFDVVHSIPLCLRTLRGEPAPGDADRHLSPAVALMMLAHYVGDIHQPLHVGAQYFDSHGMPVDPTQVSHPREDIGGNKIFFTFDPPSNQHAEDLHKFWDGNAVNLAFPNGHDHDAANTLANQEPEGWQVDSQLTVDQWAEAWANDIFPTAVKAHDFTYLGNGTGPDGKPGFKVKIPGNTYPEFAGKVTRHDIHKAGWRLAAALEACLGED